jgi:lysophospholipase L1-like esterase
MTGRRWVDGWVSTPQPTVPDHLPPPPFTRAGRAFADTTLRQTVRASIGGPRLRLRVSNAFGATPLTITAVSVALPLGGRAGVSAIRPETVRPVTFAGRPSVVVPDGAAVQSDPVDLDLPARANLTVSMHLADGQPATAITSHPGSRTTSYLLAGDHVADPDLPGAARTDHWYFLSGLRVLARATTTVAVMVGDSLTDGRGSTIDGNNRWPDRLLDRLQSHPDTSGVAVLNHGVGGTGLLDGGRGASAVDRLIRGVLARDALRWLVVFKGINDIGATAATGTAQRRVAADLIRAYDQIVAHVPRPDVRVYGATLLPFGGHAGYDDPRGFRELARQSVNEWIRTSGRFDDVVDFDLAVRDPDDPRRLAFAYDLGDHLHLNPLGYQALADAVPTRLFQAAG